MALELLCDRGNFFSGSVSLEEDVGDACLSLLKDNVLELLHVPLGFSEDAEAVREDSDFIVVPNANFGELSVALASGIDPVSTVNHALIRELADDSNGLLTNCRFGLLCAGSAMMSAIDSWVLCKSILPLTSLGRWLPVEHIKSAPEGWACLQLGKKCLIVHHVATARVNEDCIILHLPEEVGIDHSFCLCRGWCVDSDNVSVGQQVILAHVGEAQLLVQAWLLGTCRDDDIHTKSFGSLAHELANVSKANDTDSSATNSRARGKHSFVPLLLLEERVSLSCAAIDRQDEADGEFSDCAGILTWAVRHIDTLGCAVFEVNCVVTSASSNDEL